MVLLGAACGGGSEESDSPSVVPTSGTQVATVTAPPSSAGATTSPTGGTTLSFHPPLTRTGVRAVDDILAKVETADVAALLALVRFSDVACATNPLGIGAPPKCPPGAPGGTPISVFPLERCEDGFAELSEVEERVRSTIALRPRLYAVHRLDRPVRGDPAYVAVFGLREDQPAGEFKIYVADDGMIVRLGICGPPGSLSLQNVGAIVLAPLP